MTDTELLEKIKRNTSPKNFNTNVHVNISENQQQKLKHAVDTKSPVSIRHSYKDLCGNDVLALTNSQVNRMTKAYENGKGITIKMS